MTKHAKIVVIGGGTGTYVALTGLKKHVADLTAVVTVTDSGGSSGRLRDQFGFLPTGDLRQCLAALASENGEAWIRKLLLYRFDRGESLNGHNLGNLILTALTDLTGSEPQALTVAARIFHLEGTVLPISLANTQLVAEYDDGRQVVGEHEIDEPKTTGRRIVKLRVEPPAKIYTEAERKIREADLILIGPGDLYTSLLPNLLVDGAAEAITQCRGRIVFAVNLMTRLGQTQGYTAQTHLDELKKYLGQDPDFVLVNNAPIPARILKRYGEQSEFGVVDDLNNTASTTIIRTDLLAREFVTKGKSDLLRRSFLRHDSKKLARTLIQILGN